MSREITRATDDLLPWLQATYRLAKPAAQKKGATDVSALPQEDKLPRIDLDAMPDELRAFWCDGQVDGDRSRMLARMTAWLLEHGPAGDERAQVVLSQLVANPHVMTVALDHRGQDEERATEYLWKHHVLALADKVKPILEDFADEGPAPGTSEGSKPASGRYDFALEKGLVTADLRRPPSRRDWVVKPLLLAGKPAVLAGFGGSFKTQLMIQVAVCIALGISVLGLEVSSAGIAVLVLAEEDQEEVARRLGATVLAMGLTDEQIALVKARVLIFPCAGEDVRLVVQHPSGAKRNGAGDLLIASVLQMSERCGLPARFIGLDHFANLTGGKLEDASDATALTTEFSRIATKTGAAVCVAAHMPKGAAGKGEQDQHSVFGSAFNVNNTRASMLLVRMSSTEAKQFGLADPERREYVQLLLAKANYAKEGAVAWFKAEYQPDHEVVVLQEAEMKRPTPVSKSEEHAGNAQRLVDFLEAEARQGRKHTARTLEDAAGRIGEPAIPRGQVRDALNTLKAEGRVVNMPLPVGEVHGGRTHYLVVTAKANDLGVGHEE